MHTEYLYELTKNTFENLAKKNYYIDRKLKTEIVDSGVVLPPNIKQNSYFCIIGSGGVQRKDGTYVEISAQNAKEMRPRIYGNYSVSDKDIEYRNYNVIYLNCFIKHWGHFLIDVVGRLWYELEKCENNLYVYTSLDDVGEMSDNFLEFITLLGIKKEQLIRVDKPTKFKNVIVPEMAIYPGSFYTNEYKYIFDVIIKNAVISSKSDKKYSKKIYCSRGHFVSNSNNEFGEDWIEKNFIKNGYEPVYMEEMTVKEQICTIYNAEIVAMMSGTLMHNLLFARDGVKAIVLYKAYFKYINQHIINQIRKVDFYPIDVWFLPKAVTTEGPFLYKMNLKFRKFYKDFGMKLENCEEITVFTLYKFWKRYIYVNWKRILKNTTHIECCYSKKELKELCIKIKNDVE